MVPFLPVEFTKINRNHDYIELNYINKTIKFLVDTGAEISMIKEKIINDEINYDKIIKIKGLGPEIFETIGQVNLNLYKDREIFFHDFHVIHGKNLIECDGILGRDFLTKFKAIINYKTNSITLKNIFF